MASAVYNICKFGEMLELILFLLVKYKLLIDNIYRLDLIIISNVKEVVQPNV